MRRDKPQYEDVEYKFRVIALLHMLAYNSNLPSGDAGAELLYAIGSVLEGLPAEDLDLRVLDKTQLLKELTYA